MTIAVTPERLTVTAELIEPSDPARSDSLLVSLLRDLAATGDGSILGLAPARRSGLRRVARPTAAFEQRFAASYHDQYDALLRFVNTKVGDRYRAEDAVQRAYETVWRGQCARHREIENLDAYLFTAVANEANRELRVVIPERSRLTGLEDAPGATTDPLRIHAESMTLHAEINRLSRREREAVVLRVQWQLPVAEAARMMGVSEGSVKRYTSDGLAHLRDRLAAAL